VVTEFFNLARFGELVLAPSRAYQHTHTTTPSEAGYQAHLAQLAASQLVLDDDSGDQNDATSGPTATSPTPTRAVASRSTTASAAVTRSPT
jgi:predicted extracellular nuclease